MDLINTKLKAIIEFVKPRQKTLIIGLLGVVATILVSVSLAYHLAVTRIHISSNDNLKMLNESHSYIDKTIKTLIDAVKDNLNNLKLQISTQNSENDASFLRLEEKDSGLKAKVDDLRVDSEDSRNSLKETIEERSLMETRF